MPYDALGYYVPGDEESPPSVSPLQAATQEVKKVATQYNPMLLPLAARDVGRVGLNMFVSPLASAWADVAKNVQAAGAGALHRLRGDEASAQAAESRVAPVGTTRFYQAPQTPQVRGFEEQLGKLFEASKLPPVGPGSGMPGSAPISPRPMLTPNDVRVMGAEAARVGRQVRDIPTDFQNAQAGVQRLDPVTGQPTIGAKFGAAERAATQAGMRVEKSLEPVVTDALEKGGFPAAAVAGLAGSPVYAMRPAGKSLLTPVVPETARGYTPQFNVVPEMVSDVVGEGKPLVPEQTMQEINSRFLDPDANDATRTAFKSYMHQRIVDMFPDAPSSVQANNAYKALYSDNASRAVMGLQMYNDFLKTEEGQRLKQEHNLPSPEEVNARHEAAVNWLNGQFSNYINRNVAVEGEALAKLASQGLTFYTPDELLGYMEYVDPEVLRERREAAGMPPVTQIEQALTAKTTELDAKRSELAAAETERGRLFELARNQGLTDPAQLPEYAALTTPIRKLARERDKLETEVENLKLGVAYEALADVSVSARHVEYYKDPSNVSYAEQQFYPSLKKTPAGERVYLAQTRLRDLGFRDLASQFYEDVMSGKIPLDKVAKTPVDAYVRKYAEERIGKEKAQQAAMQQYKAAADANMKSRLDALAPNDKIFGNVGVIEITSERGFSPEEITKILSDDTAVLDHCIAQGGSAAQDARNPWNPKAGRRSYESIYDPATGERNPKASRDTSNYVSSVIAGDQMLSFRDSATGLPVATFQMHRAGTDRNGQHTYTVGYASGYKNGEVDSQYSAGIAAYLNSRASSIRDAGGNLVDNLGIYDRTSDGQFRQLQRDLQIPADRFKSYDWRDAPRFMTKEQAKAYMQSVGEAQPLETQQPSTQLARAENRVAMPENMQLPQAMRDDIDGAFDNAFNTLTANNDATSQAAAAHFEGIIDDIRNTYLFEGAQLGDLRMVATRLENMENFYANRPSDVSGLLADAFREAATDVQGILDAANRGHYTPAPEPAVQPPAEIPRQYVVNREVFGRGMNAARNMLSVDNYAQVENRIGDIAANMGLTLVSPELVGERLPSFVDALRRTGQAELGDNTLVGRTLLDIANRLDPRPEQALHYEVGDFDAYVDNLRRNVDAQVAHDVVRISNTVANDMGSTIRMALENRPTEFAQRLIDQADVEENAMTEDALRELADQIAPPVRDPAAEAAAELMAEPEDARLQPVQDIDLFPELPAQQRLTPEQVNDIAFELFQDTRRGEGRALNELQTTLQALETGNFDDMRFRALPADQRDRAQRDVAHQIRAIMDDLRITLPAEPQAQQPNIAPFRPIAGHATEMTYDQLRDALTPGEIGEVAALHDGIVRNNPDPDEIRTIAHLVYDHQMGPWEQFADTERAMLYMELLSTANRMEAAGGEPQGYAHGGIVRKYANGGIVHTTPSLDEMRYALMMRS